MHARRAPQRPASERHARPGGAEDDVQARLGEERREGGENRRGEDASEGMGDGGGSGGGGRDERTRTRTRRTRTRLDDRVGRFRVGGAARANGRVGGAPLREPRAEFVGAGQDLLARGAAVETPAGGDRTLPHEEEEVDGGREVDAGARGGEARHSVDQAPHAKRSRRYPRVRANDAATNRPLYLPHGARDRARRRARGGRGHRRRGHFLVVIERHGRRRALETRGRHARRVEYEPPPPIRPRRVGESARRTRARARGLCSRASEGTSNASERAARDAISNVPFGAGAPVSAARKHARRRDNATTSVNRRAPRASSPALPARTIRLAATPRARRTRTDRTTWDPRSKRSTTCLPSKIPRRSPPPRPARCVADPTAPSPIVIGADPRREKAPRRREWRILTTTDHPPSNAQDGDAPDLSGMDMAELQKMMVRLPSPRTRALERIRASPSDPI